MYGNINIIISNNIYNNIGIARETTGDIGRYELCNVLEIQYLPSMAWLVTYILLLLLQIIFTTISESTERLRVICNFHKKV